MKEQFFTHAALETGTFWKCQDRDRFIAWGQKARTGQSIRIYGGDEGLLKTRLVLHFGSMNWKRMLAYVTGSVDEELRLRNEYLVTENRILRNQLKGRLRLTDPERSVWPKSADVWGERPSQKWHKSSAPTPSWAGIEN